MHHSRCVKRTWYFVEKTVTINNISLNILLVIIAQETTMLRYCFTSWNSLKSIMKKNINAEIDMPTNEEKKQQNRWCSSDTINRKTTWLFVTFFLIFFGLLFSLSCLHIIVIVGFWMTFDATARNEEYSEQYHEMDIFFFVYFSMFSIVCI